MRPAERCDLHQEVVRRGMAQDAQVLDCSAPVARVPADDRGRRQAQGRRPALRAFDGAIGLAAVPETDGPTEACVGVARACLGRGGVTEDAQSRRPEAKLPGGRFGRWWESLRTGDVASALRFPYPVTSS